MTGRYLFAVPLLLLLIIATGIIATGCDRPRDADTSAGSSADVPSDSSASPGERRTYPEGRAAWSVALPGVAMNAVAPAVDDGVAFVAAGRSLRAYDAATGAERWTLALDAPPVQIQRSLGARNLVLSDEHVYLAHFDHVIAADRASGKLMWHTEIPNFTGVDLQHLAANGTHLLVGGVGEAALLRQSDGAVEARVPVPSTEGQPAARVFQPMLAADGRMVLPAYVRVPDERATTGSVRVVSCDGTTLWARTTERPSYETPQGDLYTTGGGVHGVTLHNGAAIYTTGQSVVARDLDDGSVRWRSFMREDGFGTGPAAHGNRVVVGSTTGRIFGLDAGDGTEQWRRDVQGGMLVPARFATASEAASSTASETGSGTHRDANAEKRGDAGGDRSPSTGQTAEGRLVAYQIDDGYGVLYALDARTGDVRWSESPPENSTDADATYRTAPGIGPNVLVIVGSRRIYGLKRKGR